MSFTDALSALTLFVFVSSITPGPNNLMLLSSGTRFGFRRTIPHMLGIGVGFMVMIALVGLGLAQLFLLYPPLHLALKIASISYLLYLAWKIATSKPPSAEAGDETGKPRHQRGVSTEAMRAEERGEHAKLHADRLPSVASNFATASLNRGEAFSKYGKPGPTRGRVRQTAPAGINDSTAPA